MLLASGCFGYIHEPFNLTSPPGTIRVPAPYWYMYVDSANEERVLPALTDALAFSYPLGQELARCRRPTDLLHTAKMWFRCVRSRNLRPLVKDPHAVLSAAWFECRLRSQVLIIVRHPAAVVSSWRRLGWDFDFTNLLRQPSLMGARLEPFREEMIATMDCSRDTIDRISLLWRIIYSVVAEYESQFRDFIVIRHEDLSRRPVDAFAALYRQLGLKYSKKVVSLVARSSSHRNPGELSAADPYVTVVDSIANVDAWKRRLTDEELARIRHTTADAAERYYADAEWER